MSLFCINLPKEKPAAAILAEDSYTHWGNTFAKSVSEYGHSSPKAFLSLANLSLRMSCYEGLGLQEKQCKTHAEN